MMQRILIVILGLFIFSCSSKPDLPAIEKVDLDKFMGTWYEIGALPVTAKKNVPATK